MKYHVLVGVPSAGAPMEVANDHSYLASAHHYVTRMPSCTEGLNFNSLWCHALNRGEEGAFTHFAITHSDIRVVEDEPGLRWFDRMVEEMDALNLDFISVPNAIKDARGLTSSGIGDPNDRWNPFRRWTINELGALPKTFTADMVGYKDKFLLHNEALCVFDLRKPLWYETDDQGGARCDFNVVEWIHKVNGQWIRDQETEDWKFSRDLWRMGARTGITSRIELFHFGIVGWSNRTAFGSYENGDEDTAAKWRQSQPA